MGIIVFMIYVYDPERDTWHNIRTTTTFEAAKECIDQIPGRDGQKLEVHRVYRDWYFERWDVRN